MIGILGLLLVGQAKPLADLPFESVGSRIYLSAKLNGQPVTAILDTGAAASVMDLAMAEQRKLKLADAIKAAGVGEKGATGRLVEDGKVTIGDGDTISQKVDYALPLGSVSMAEGRPLEVILGTDFLQKFVIEIDYEAGHLRVFPADTVVQSNTKPTKFELKNNQPLISARIRIGARSEQVVALVDTGASGAAILSNRYVASVPYLEMIKKTAKTNVSGGVGGWIQGHLARADAITIGDSTVLNPVVTLIASTGGAEGANATHDLLIGGEILRRHKVTLDYPHSQMFFEPNSMIGKPFEADKLGLQILALGKDFQTLTVVGLVPGSSAEAAGFKVGDVLELVDGEPVAKRSLSAWREAFREARTKAFEIVVTREGKQQTVKADPKAVI